MNEDRINTERVDIARRVADFRATQQRFQRERESYFEATIEKLRSRGNEVERETLIPRISSDVH